jgi:hypothetical protein
MKVSMRPLLAASSARSGDARGSPLRVIPAGGHRGFGAAQVLRLSGQRREDVLG